MKCGPGLFLGISVKARLQVQMNVKIVCGSTYMRTTYAVSVYYYLYDESTTGRSYARFPNEKPKTHVPSHRRSIVMCWRTKNPTGLSYVHVIIGYDLYIQGWSGDQWVTPISRSYELVSVWLDKFITTRFPKELIDNTRKCLLRCIIHATWNKQCYTGDREMNEVGIRRISTSNRK